MTSTKGQSDQAAELRQQAEEIARDKIVLAPATQELLTREEIQHVLHELDVHQIELEIQNEELRRTQVELDKERARYFDLYDLAPVGYCSISELGLIMEANLAAAELLDEARDALIKQPISRFILKEDQDIYYMHRKQLFETGARQICELRMLKNDGMPFWASLVSSITQELDGAVITRVAMSDIHLRKQAEVEVQILHAGLELRVEQRTAELAQANVALQLETVERIHAEETQLSAVVEERTRIAREIHDTLAQGFVGIILQLGVAEDALADDPQVALTHMIRARQLARDSLTDARRFMWALRPQLLEQGDLVYAITSIIESMEKETSILMDFTYQGERTRLPKELEHGLLRIFQEALKNAGKHSQAQNIRVMLAFDECQVKLCIEDDGRGFDAASAPFLRGLGLRILKERTAKMHGTATITSQPGQGAKVMVQVPISDGDIEPD